LRWDVSPHDSGNCSLPYLFAHSRFAIGGRPSEVSPGLPERVIGNPNAWSVPGISNRGLGDLHNRVRRRGNRRFGPLFAGLLAWALKYQCLHERYPLATIPEQQMLAIFFILGIAPGAALTTVSSRAGRLVRRFNTSGDGSRSSPPRACQIDGYQGMRLLPWHDAALRPSTSDLPHGPEAT